MWDGDCTVTSLGVHYTTFGHPLHDFVKYIKSHLKAHMFYIIDGQKNDEIVCCLCKNRFKGLTGTCNIIKQEGDETCHFEHLNPPLPSVLQVKGGVYLPPKYFNSNYELYYRDKNLGDYEFNLETVEATLLTRPKVGLTKR